MRSLVVGIDVGGTFTDFVVLDGTGWRVEKRPSTPDDPARAVLEGLADLDPRAAAAVRHGTTVATNALLERRGARTVFVTSAGFEDLLHIGRGERGDLYALVPRDRPTLVPPERTIGVAERMGADGTIVTPLGSDARTAALARIAAADPEAVAVCFLWSHLYPAHEAALGAALRAALPAGTYVSLSHEVLPVFREFERASTTVVTAYLGPVIERYLHRLADGMGPRSLAVMASHGGTLAAREAVRHAAATVLSGPAAGALATAEVARRAGATAAIGVDIGGTSTDVTAMTGAPALDPWSVIDGLPIHLPAVRVETIGAGGGSRIWVDSGRALRVGPASAGAVPGPAAYGRGGTDPTLTDAQVVLGRLPAGLPLAGGLRLDAAAARRALDRVASALAIAPEAAAEGALAVAEAGIERALRRVTMERGLDPRVAVLVAFGGAGPLHVCALADAVGCPIAIVPAGAGVLSAIGLATAAPTAVVSRAAPRGARDEDVEALFRALEAEATRGLDAPPTVTERVAEMRYRGQAWEIGVPWAAGTAGDRFHDAHQRRYGYSRRDAPVEVVTLRVVARSAGSGLPSPPPAETGNPVTGTARLWIAGRWVEAPLLAAERLAPEATVMGPAIIALGDATVYVAPLWCAVMTSARDLRLAALEPH